MITLTLLHPLQAVPVQSWTFDSESVVTIGRATDNNVILYSAVVSRHHVEVKRGSSGWEIANLGANGTYVDGKRITRMKAVDGMILRLASSGPKIQIRLDRSEHTSATQANSGKRKKTRLGQIPKDTLTN